MFIDTFCFQKCLETVKRQNPLKYSKNLVDSPVSRHFLYSKVSGNSEMTKSLEIMTFQEVLLFLLFRDSFGRLEGLKVGMLEGWNVGRLEGSSNERVFFF